MYLWICAPSKASDQTAHLHSLIWRFTGCILDSQWCKVSSGGQRRLWSAFVLLIKIWTVSSENVLPGKIYITVNCLKIRTLYTILFLHNFFFYAVVSKILSGMANSVDPDQTAPDLGLHCLHMPFCWELWCTKFYDIYFNQIKIFTGQALDNQGYKVSSCKQRRLHRCADWFEFFVHACGKVRFLTFWLLCCRRLC